VEGESSITRAFTATAYLRMNEDYEKQQMQHLPFFQHGCWDSSLRFRVAAVQMGLTDPDEGSKPNLFL
jgi:hypothetical protein